VKRALAYLSLVLLAVLPFLGGLSGGFIEDDIDAIRERPELRAGGDLWRVWSDNYWGEIWGGLYRPLTVFSYGVDRLVFGAEDLERAGDGLGPPAPWGVHAANLAWNAGCAVLLFVLLARLAGGRRFGRLGAWFGAALFAVHPAHVEAVVHMVGRADLLAAFFFLAAWVAHDDAPGDAHRARAWLGGFLYLLSLSSKESGAALPAVLVCEAAFRTPWRGLGALVKSQLAPMLPYALALVAFVGVRGFVLGHEMTPPRGWVLYAPGGYLAFADPAPFEVALTMTHALGEYVRMLVAPLALSADYSGFPHATAPTAAVVVAGLALFALVALAVRAARRGVREPLAWLAVFVWTFLPVSNLVFVSGVVMAERAIYLPSIAFAGLAAWACASLIARNRAWIALPALVLALFAARTAVRAPVWSDSETLFEETVQKGRYRGHLALTGAVDARLRRMAAEPARAAELLPAALELARESVAFHRTTLNVAQLAWLLEQSGALAESFAAWSQVESADPARRADVERCLARIATRAGDRDLAWAAIRTAGDALTRAEVGGDAARAAFWRGALERLLAPSIERAVEREDWLFAADGCAVLERLNPRHPSLARHRVPALEGAIRALQAAGREADAHKLAVELRRIDAANALAAELLGR
jgi:hypothetical protein